MKLSHSLSQLMRLLATSEADRDVAREVIEPENMQRLWYMVVIGIIVSVFHVVAFMFINTSNDPAVMLWQRWIIIAHSVTALTLIVLGIVYQFIYLSRNKPDYIARYTIVTTPIGSNPSKICN